jgi:hypothetical protein
MLTIFAAVSNPACAALFGISEQQEIEAGKQAQKEAYKQYGQPLPANNPMSRRVATIGMRLAALSSRKDIPYSYQVLKNDKVLNAFAAPGGPVFVTTKLMKNCFQRRGIGVCFGPRNRAYRSKAYCQCGGKTAKSGAGRWHFGIYPRLQQ